MVERLLGSYPLVIQRLEDDHRRVEALFVAYEKGKRPGKKKILRELIHELTVHAAIEERIVYPAFRKAMSDSHAINEAYGEHHLVHVLLQALQRLAFGETFDAKVQVLKEFIHCHVKEEEGAVFPAALNGKDVNWETLDRQAQRVRKGGATSSGRHRTRSEARLARAA
jgi:hemerythrin superfamily protein